MSLTLSLTSFVPSENRTRSVTSERKAWCWLAGKMTTTTMMMMIMIKMIMIMMMMVLYIYQISPILIFRSLFPISDLLVLILIQRSVERATGISLDVHAEDWKCKSPDPHNLSVATPKSLTMVVPQDWSYSCSSLSFTVLVPLINLVSVSRPVFR